MSEKQDYFPTNDETNIDPDIIKKVVLVWNQASGKLWGFDFYDKENRKTHSVGRTETGARHELDLEEG